MSDLAVAFLMMALAIPTKQPRTPATTALLKLSAGVGRMPRAFGPTLGARVDDFHIVVQRQESRDGLVIGSISVNDEQIGTTYENATLLIPAGNYKGVIRYWSGSGLAQGPFGSVGKVGDFLLEVSGVPGRTDILFHGGSKSAQSKGCVLLGGIDRSVGLPDDHALRKLRLLFYGSDAPSSTPNKNITIDILDKPSNPGN